MGLGKSEKVRSPTFSIFNCLRNLFRYRLRNSKILIAGLNGLGAEIAKNIILAGVKSVTFLDDGNVTQLDFASNFFVSRDQLGNNRGESSIKRAQALNPLVELRADAGRLADKDEEYFKQFDVIVILEASTGEQIRINNFCRANNVKFYAADMWGMFGYSFIDLQKHEYSEYVMLIIISKQIPFTI